MISRPTSMSHEITAPVGPISRWGSVPTISPASSAPIPNAPVCSLLALKPVSISPLMTARTGSRSTAVTYPSLSVYDLQIKRGDLIVATHGRSFWILDDLTPLRAAAAIENSERHLFIPRDWARIASTPFEGHVDLEIAPGKNSAIFLRCGSDLRVGKGRRKSHPPTLPERRFESTSWRQRVLLPE